VLRITGGLLTLTVLATACSSGGSNSGLSASPSSHQLVIGQVAPQTGPLVFTGLPQFAGVRLASQDINASGGVLGHPIKVVLGTDSSRASGVLATARTLIRSHSDAIIGSPGSSISAFDALVASQDLPQCAAASTAPVATVRPMSRLSVRTMPPNNTVASVLASEAASKGAKSVGIIARDDEYGHSLANAVNSALSAKGIKVTQTGFYVPAMVASTPAVAQVTASKADAVVVLSFGEGALIVRSLMQAGVRPNTILGSPGMYLPSLNSIASPTDPRAADGLTTIGIGGDGAFDQRLAQVTGGLLSYGAQSYDCAMLVALAAIQAKSVDPGRVAEHLASVTTGSHACTTFVQCKSLLMQGKSIEYDGPSGPIKLNSHGDPTSGRFIVGQFMAGTLFQVAESDVPTHS
jgi:branched-chain amino acid transport system substrate-binding protein